MKMISWNVNGLRAVMGKGFMETFEQLDADLFCLQETKLQEGQITMELPGYHQFWNYAEKKGYSGTAVFSKQEPLSVRYGIGEDAFASRKYLYGAVLPEGSGRELRAVRGGSRTGNRPGGPAKDI